MKTNKRGPEPLKRTKIVEYVRTQIATGKWTPNDILPKRTWFIEKFHATHNTIQKTFDQLRAEGFIVSVPHVGTKPAPEPPFKNRHLIMLYGNSDTPAMLTKAILKAAQNIEKKRGVVFEYAYILDCEAHSETFLRVSEKIHAHMYASVFMEAPVLHIQKYNLTMLDNVPIGGIVAQSKTTKGSFVAPLIQPHQKATANDLRPHFEECVKRGLRKIAVIDNDIYDIRREAFIRNQAQTYGLSCGPYHVQTLNVETNMLHVAKNTIALMMAPEMPWQPEAVITGDDNFLPLLEDVLIAHHGEEKARTFFIASQGNLPALPPTKLPVVFHGFNMEKTLEKFLDFADYCHINGNTPARLPQIITF